jgi:cell division septation protein DedD
MSREKSGGLSLTTLLIASASAAAAAVVVPLFWQRGSIVAAAITPVIVTLVSESLRAPVTKVQEVGVWRRTPQGTAVRQPEGRDFRPGDPEEERIEVDPQHTDDPFGLYEDDRGGSGGFFTRRKVMIALVTGVIAFAIAAVVVTAGELTFGDSTSKHETTFFGGRRSSTPTPTPTPTATPKEGETPTPTPSASATPSATATPTPSVAATPSATATPQTAAPNATAVPTP